jgi:hypothetical protein
VIDYYQKNKEQERRKKKIRARVIAFFVILLTFLFVSALILRSDIFKIKDISVASESSVSADEAKNSFNELIHSGNIFNFILGKDNVIAAYIKGKDIENKLKDELTFATNLTVKFDIAKRSVLISFSEREKFGLWCFKQEQDVYSCWWFDRNGIAFEQGPDSSGALIRKVIYNSGETVSEGKEVLNKENFDNLMNAFDFLEQIGVRINTLVIDDSIAEEIKTDSKDYPIFYFSLRENPLPALLSVKELIPKFSTIQYIDLRTKNRVFYK